MEHNVMTPDGVVHALRKTTNDRVVCGLRAYPKFIEGGTRATRTSQSVSCLSCLADEGESSAVSNDPWPLKKRKGETET